MNGLNAMKSEKCLHTSLAQGSSKFPDFTRKIIANAQALGTPKGGPGHSFIDPDDAKAAVNSLLSMELYTELKQLIHQWLYTYKLEYEGHFPAVVQGAEQAIMVAMEALLKCDFEFVKFCLPHIIFLHGKSGAKESVFYASEIKLVGLIIKQMLNEKYGQEWNKHANSGGVISLLETEGINAEASFTKNWPVLPPDVLSVMKHDMYEYFNLVMKQ